MRTEAQYPHGWKEELSRSLDFEAAYEALEGYEHFHSYTLRGLLRHVQARFDEALRLYEEAEIRYGSYESSPQNRDLYGRLGGSRLSALVFQEALTRSSSASENTDAELERYLSIDEGNLVRLDKNVALYELSRGDYASALERLERVIAAHRRTPQACISAYICAAAASAELGLHRESRRHYENAELTMCCSCNRLVFALYLTWLVALSRHWGWEGEQKRWSETIRVLDCPEDTRAALLRRASIMQEICESSDSLVLA